jgi:membrane fusion protein, heavy metal efflux system
MIFTKPFVISLAFSASLALVLSGCDTSKPDASAQTADKQAANKAPSRDHDHANEKPGAEKHDTHEEPLKLSEEEIRAAGIQVQAVTEQAVHGQITATASVQANQDRLAHIQPRVAGRVVKVNANLGDQVRAGQTLAVLDSIELGEAQSAYRQAESEAALARAGFERAERLIGEQIIPQKDYLRARAEYEKARTALRSATEKLRLLGVSPGKDSGSTFPLSSPFIGTVIEKDAVLGELIQPDKSLFTVADLSVVWIEADLYEKDLGRIAPGGEAHVSVAAYPDETYSGRVTYISSTADKETRTVKARIEVANPEGRLKPGMFASVALDASTAVKALAVPDEAVVLMEGKPTVFVQEHGGFEPRTVTLGDKLQGRVIVKEGLEDGDGAVVKGAYALKARLLKSQIGEGHAH